MALAADARRAVPGLVGLFMGRQEAVLHFDLSLAAFWRVFWLVFGLILSLEVAMDTVAAHDSAQNAHRGILIALSVIGGSTAAAQILMAMGGLESWEDRILHFLVPVLWIGGAFWSAVTLWRVAAFGMGVGSDVDVTARIVLSLAAIYTAWQAARSGLGVTPGEAFNVLLVCVCAEIAGFGLVNMTLLLIP